MKRVMILCAAALMASVAVHAQMLPDSTVQIVAYWSKGDKVAYDCTSTSYVVDENGNRSDVEASSETRVFEVLDKRDDGYTLRISYKNVFCSKTIEFLTPEECNTLGEAITITFNTDEYGSITGIVNSESCRASVSELLDKMIEQDWKKLDKKARKGLSKEQMKKKMEDLLCSDEALKLYADADISLFFAYHGARFDTTRVYSFPQSFTLPVGDQTFEVNTDLWVDEELTDERSAVIRTDALATRHVLFPPMLDYTIRMAKVACAAAGVEITEDDIAAIPDELNKRLQDFTMEVSTAAEISLSTGWPIQWKKTNEVVQVSDGKMQKKVSEDAAIISIEQ